MTKTTTLSATLIAGLILSVPQASQAQINLPNLFPFPNQSGILETNSATGNGQIDLSGPFFQALGTNGRSCFSCHRPDQGWTISALGMQILFDLTAGKDPVFSTFDGTNCGTTVDTSTLQGRKKAYSLLTSRGLIRVPLPLPATTEFEVLSVSSQYDPTNSGCGNPGNLSVYRRPLPTTNLKFLSAVLWDGRANTPSFAPIFVKITNAPGNYPGSLNTDLAGLTFAATNTHEQGNISLTDPRIQQIVDFENSLYTAQAFDFQAGDLTSGANGGPKAISAFPFYIGINDPFGFPNNPLGCGTGATSNPCTPFTSTIFTLYNAWTNSNSGFTAARKASIARGEALFNNTPITITGVAGINGPSDASQAPVAGHCGTCHSTPGVGDHSISAPLNIGIADTTNILGASFLPVFTLKNTNPSSPAYGTMIQTTDPGRALISGAWADVGKFKGPILRGLASRAPYFHNGIAKSLDDVVNFYNNRFGIGFTAQQHADLVAFLSSL